MIGIAVADPPLSAWRRMRLWAAAHAVDDLYQGLVPACVPYFVLDRHYGYVAASGLTLAATLGAALPQLVVGFLVDRYSLSWMAGAGVSLAGVGLGLSGVVPGYALVWLLLFASGLGVAMFHPAAGKAARRAAMEGAGEVGGASAMSVFATGGNVGFFLAPVLATPALDAMGLGATVLFIPPAVLTGFVLLRHQQRTAPPRQAATAVGTDRWGPFLLLTAVEVTRSVTFFGTSTFIELYWIAHLHASRPVAGAALTCFLTGGVAGTLLGGRLADRFGLTRTILVGNAAAIPALIALRACPGAGIALAAALAAGVTVRIPFSVLVKLGQDYLPSRPGTAAGVTLGLAVSAGGLAAPVFGAVAAAHGTPAVFSLLCLLPVPAVALSLLLPEPGKELPLHRSPPGGGLMPVSRLAHIPGIGVDEIGDAADATGNPDLLRLENLDTDVPPPAVAREITHAAVEDDDANSYLPFQGHRVLREAAAEHVSAITGGRYDPGTQCVSVAGGLNGILNVLLATVDPGQEVVIGDPIYAGLVNRIRLAGGIPRHVRCVPGERGWATDPGELAAAIGPQTAAVLLMSPAMPTGAVLSGEHFDAIADPVNRYGAWVIWDAAMERLVFGDNRPVHPGAHPGLAARTITVGSASKELRMIGWRVGWVVGPQPIMKDIGLVGLTNVVCQVGIAQQAVAAALRHPDASADVAAATAIWEQRCQHILDQLAGYPGIRPGGGWSLLIDCASMGLSGAEASQRLFTRAEIAATPMTGWGPSGERYLRLVFANEPVERLGDLRTRFDAAFA